MAINFNRKLNIKAFFRTLPSGKRIRINPHSRRAALLRGKEALEELAKSKTEAGYVVSNSGKLSKKISQNSFKQVFYRLKGQDLAARKGISAKLHSHNLPEKYKQNLTALTPSTADVMNSLKTGELGAVISSKDGSIFRYRQGQVLDKALPFEKRAIIQNLENKTKKFNEILYQRKDLTPDEKLLVTDRYFQHLNKRKLIRYRIRPSETLKARQKELNPKLDKIIKDTLLTLTRGKNTYG
jgi:hypothetical protein